MTLPHRISMASVPKKRKKKYLIIVIYNVFFDKHKFKEIKLKIKVKELQKNVKN